MLAPGAEEGRVRNTQVPGEGGGESMKHISVLSVLVALSLFAALALLPASVQAHEEADFNDRFAGQITGARGEIEFKDDQEGSFIEISEIEVEGLLADHPYEIWVTAGLAPAGFDPSLTQVFGPFFSDEDGELEVEELEVGPLAPGSYRIDVFLTHTHDDGVTGPLAALVIDPFTIRDILLACDPPVFVTLEADD